MKFDNKIEGDPERSLHGWYKYFQDRYSFAYDNEFDDTFKQTVETELNAYRIAHESPESSVISRHVALEQLLDIIATMPNEKSVTSN